MTANELSAAIGALMNGENPDTGDEVDFDDDLNVGATLNGQKLVVTGWTVSEEGRLVLELAEDDSDREPPGDIGDLLAGQPDIPPIPPTE